MEYRPLGCTLLYIFLAHLAQPSHVQTILDRLYSVKMKVLALVIS